MCQRVKVEKIDLTTSVKVIKTILCKKAITVSRPMLASKSGIGRSNKAKKKRTVKKKKMINETNFTYSYVYLLRLIISWTRKRKR